MKNRYVKTAIQKMSTSHTFALSIKLPEENTWRQTHITNGYHPLIFVNYLSFQGRIVDVRSCDILVPAVHFILWSVSPRAFVVALWMSTMLGFLISHYTYKQRERQLIPN